MIKYNYLEIENFDKINLLKILEDFVNSNSQVHESLWFLHKITILPKTLKDIENFNEVFIKVFSDNKFNSSITLEARFFTHDVSYNVATKTFDLLTKFRNQNLNINKLYLFFNMSVYWEPYYKLLKEEPNQKIFDICLYWHDSYKSKLDQQNVLLLSNFFKLNPNEMSSTLDYFDFFKNKLGSKVYSNFTLMPQFLSDMGYRELTDKDKKVLYDIYNIVMSHNKISPICYWGIVNGMVPDSIDLKILSDGSCYMKSYFDCLRSKHKLYAGDLLSDDINDIKNQIIKIRNSFEQFAPEKCKQCPIKNCHHSNLSISTCGPYDTPLSCWYKKFTMILSAHSVCAIKAGKPTNLLKIVQESDILDQDTFQELFNYTVSRFISKSKDFVSRYYKIS